MGCEARIKAEGKSQLQSDTHAISFRNVPKGSRLAYESVDLSCLHMSADRTWPASGFFWVFRFEFAVHLIFAVHLTKAVIPFIIRHNAK